MLQYPSLSNYHNADDTLDSSYLNHPPADVPPPASGRVKCLFHDPEQMPTMGTVFSEYAWPKDTDTCPPALCNGASLPSSSRASPSGNEMCTREGHSRSTMRLTKESGCKLDERALSDGFRARSRGAGLPGSSEPWPSSLYDPCSPIARADTVGPPLQDSIEAYAEVDGGFRPPPPSTVPAKSANGGYMRGREIPAGASISQSNYIGSMDSAVTPSLCSDGSRSTIRRQSVSWSPDNTTIAPSSWLSDREGLFEPCTSKGKSTTLDIGHDRHNLGPADSENDLDVYAPSSSSFIKPRHLNAREKGRILNPSRKENNWAALHDGHYPTGNSQPVQSMSTVDNDPTLIAPTTTGPRFPRRRTTKREDDSLIPSFYSEAGPSLENGISSRRKSGSGLTGRVASALHHRYVAISYKVRLAVYRTEKTVGRKFSRHSRRTGERDEGGDV